MLNINFDRLLGDKKPAPAPKPRRKKITGKSLALGDVIRLADLPTEVNDEFLEKYRDGLDRYLHVYVVRNNMTLTEASKYKEYIFDTIFGNKEHQGIFQFLRVKSGDMFHSDREMVSAAENYLMRGWHVAKEGDEYWLLNDAFEKLLNVTGSSDISEEASTLVFTPATAHLFLSDGVASKVSALAKKAGFDADSLASMGQLDLLLGETNSRDLAGYLLNYNAFRFLLKKSGKYKVLDVGMTLEDLYDKDFRLGSQIFYPTLSKVVIESKNESMLLTPVASDLNETHLVNSSLLGVMASDLRSKVYRGKVVPQVVLEVGELGYVIALATEFWTTDTVRMSFTELYDVLRRVDSAYRGGSVTKSYYESARSSFSEILLTEVMLLGRNLTLASFGFDSVGGKFFVYASSDVFAEQGRVTSDAIPENSAEFFELCMKNGFSRSFVEKNLGALAKFTSAGYRDRLSGLALDSSNYGLEMESVHVAFLKARDEVLHALG